MVALVTIGDVRDRLRIDASDDDFDVQAMTEQATDIVVDYLKKPDHSWTSETAPPRIKAAILLVVGRLYMDREGQLEGGILSEAVKALVYRDRDPAIA